MYFWTKDFRKTMLDKYLKSPFSEDPSTNNMVIGRNTVEILTAAPLPY